MAAAVSSVQRYQGVQKESAGYKLLASMGWKEGEGLGAEGQGIKSHIRVKKNFENWGVGAVESADRSRDWSAGMLEFHRVLSSLSEVTSVHASQGSASDSGSSSSEEESEAEEVAPPPPPAPKAVTHRGRFKRRESAKDVRAYGGEDLTAILGGVQDPFAGLAAAVQAPAAVPAAEAKKPRKPRKPVAPLAPALPRVDPDAWWGDYFERSGGAGAAAPRPRKRPDGGIAVHSFREDDQEALYHRVQSGATQAHAGLGRAGMPKKVAGARWEGTKTRLGSDSESEGGAESEEETEEEEGGGRGAGQRHRHRHAAHRGCQSTRCFWRRRAQPGAALDRRPPRPRQAPGARPSPRSRPRPSRSSGRSSCSRRCSSRRRRSCGTASSSRPWPAPRACPRRTA
ncbi:hypothetical protein QBZ16_003309 [Prototheca wickerhamii]|uniref:G-patch domain-containing protein n=1 Tax=Prototheca wickerhamii TaxID=3111 RepID=A0AAD9IH91_PROWI|nr:hypothetical protein QBZ16_003309 [Prototheca wickerhamii]